MQATERHLNDGDTSHERKRFILIMGVNAHAHAHTNGLQSSQLSIIRLRIDIAHDSKKKLTSSRENN